MTPTPAQATLIRSLPERFGLERIRRIWIFGPHQGKSRESGLIVVSLLAEESGAKGLLALVTLRYRAEVVKGELKIEDSTAQEGWAPPERIDRVIEGVLARGGEEAGEPHEAQVDGDEDRWSALLEELGIRLDPASQ